MYIFWKNIDYIISKKINDIGSYDISHSSTTAGGLAKDSCKNIVTFTRATAGYGSIHLAKRVGIVFESDFSRVLAERFNILHNEITQFNLVLKLRENKNFLEDWGIGVNTTMGADYPKTFGSLSTGKQPKQTQVCAQHKQ